MDFEKLFLENDKVIYNSKELILLDKLDILSHQKIILIFNESNSNWRQGIILKTKGFFKIKNKKVLNRMILWYDTAATEMKIEVNSKDNILIVYNVWDVGNGVVHYWHNGAAMNVIRNDNIYTYYCNDGFPDDDMNDLIFTIIKNEK